MRKLGMITDIEDNIITLTIWDVLNSKIKEITITNINKNNNWMIGHIVEYLEEQNQIIPLNNVNYTKEEELELSKIFKETITRPKVSLAFYEQLDILEGKVPIKNSQR